MRNTPGSSPGPAVRMTWAGKPPRSSTQRWISSRSVVVRDEPPEDFFAPDFLLPPPDLPPLDLELPPSMERTALTTRLARLGDFFDEPPDVEPLDLEPLDFEEPLVRELPDDVLFVVPVERRPLRAPAAEAAAAPPERDEPPPLDLPDVLLFFELPLDFVEPLLFFDPPRDFVEPLLLI
ncbi:MAG TPA: hypothetical protein VE010_15990, partial [Thermoanaerobaculia bacterium]|nr:hypothetical protein [Thermoanaerobaculia bacterium]